MANPDDCHYLVLDSESVPDGRLLGMVKYPGLKLSEPEAIARAQAEARADSPKGSDFLPVTFQVPVAVCILRVGAGYELQAITCLDAPEFRSAEIVRKFWTGLAKYPRAKLVTYNGRGFDLPLLEMAAFRYGCSAGSYFRSYRNRFQGQHLDLMDWMSNYGSFRPSGGLDLLSKILGKPGKMETTGNQVYDMHREGKRQAINDYCLFDTLDTYFVFLRCEVLAGRLDLDQEQRLVRDQAKAWIASQVSQFPALQQYLSNWGDWNPWP